MKERCVSPSRNGQCRNTRTAGSDLCHYHARIAPLFGLMNSFDKDEEINGDPWGLALIDNENGSCSVEWIHGQPLTWEDVMHLGLNYGGAGLKKTPSAIRLKNLIEEKRASLSVSA